MKKSKLVVLMMAVVFLLGMLSACGAPSVAPSAAGSTAAQSAAESTASAERETVNFWYLWGGAEADLIEQIIAAYNESQDKYEVVGASTPDQQAIITAISGGQGPDITDDFGGSVPKYADEQIAQNLDEFIAADGLDTSVFVEAALEHQRYNGSLYALPVSVNVFALYYNKDLLEAAGITEMPTTLEELMVMCEQTTVAENGTLTQIGSPFVPANYWPTTFTYASGGDFGTVGNLTPDTEGFRNALTFLQSQVNTFGKDAMGNFVSSGSANLYTPQDPFLNGTQVFRIDGPWLYNIATDAGVNFGLMPVPGTEATGGTGWSPIDTSMMYIPTTSTHKEGAWDFMKYICMGEGNKMFCMLKGDLPPTTTLLDDPDISGKSPAYETFLEIIANNNLRSLPPFLQTAEYDKAIRDAVESVMLGDSVDDAVAAMVAAVETIG